MGWRDQIRQAAGTAAGFAGETLSGWADSQFSDPVIKAEDADGPPRTKEKGPVPTDDDRVIDDPKAMLWDPFSIIEQLGYKERPTQITYGTLRAIVQRMPIVQSVIQHRVNQIASFAKPQHDRFDLGFRIRLRDREVKPTAADKKWIKQMEGLLMHTGVWDDPRDRDNFEMFLRRLAWDSLVYDQACFEVVPNRRGVPAQWYAVDASTIRLADTASAYFNKKTEANDTKYVQIYDGMIITEYTNEELSFGIRNPRSDMRLYGYGTSELEMLMTTITSLLWAWQYNQRLFSQGSAQKGILNFKGAIPERQMKAFRRHWYTMLTGVENAWRTPITNAEGLEWIDLQNSNRDMEFNAWMDFLIKVTCSMYSMDPVEINFQYGNVGQKSTMNESSNKEKLTESKERGLRPTLKFLASQINRNIIWPIDENYELEFVGLDAATHDDIAKLNAQRVKTTRTIDELRAEDDLPPLPDGNGAVILDPQWMQMVQQKEQNEMMAEQGGFDGNGFDADGDEDGDGTPNSEDPDFNFEQEFGDSEPDQGNTGAGKTKSGAPKAAKPAKRAERATAEKSLRKSLTEGIIIDMEL